MVTSIDCNNSSYYMIVLVSTQTDDNSYNKYYLQWLQQRQMTIVTTITGYNDGYYKNDEKVTTNIT